MNLREEVKDIYENRPTREERAREAEERRAYHRQGKHDAGGRRFLLPKQKPYLVALILMMIAAVCFVVMLMVFNILPADLTITLIVLMVGMLVAAGLLFGSKKRWLRVCGILIAALYMGVFVLATSFMGNTYAMLNKISGEHIAATGPAAKKVNVAEEPFNIYITGIDQWAYEKGTDLERSDVNMIITVNPLTKKVLITSIPRDSYVKLYTAKQMDKLTHTGVYGVDETLNTVEEWLGIDLNYYVKMNFTGARDIINAMGGIEVYSPVAFTSSLEGYDYQKGWNTLNGKQAIYFARERHAFEGKDSIRVENQQRVVKAMIKKMTSSRVLLTKYGDIMDAAGEQMTTNLSTEEMTALAKMQIAELASWDVETQKIDGYYDQDYVASLTQEQKFDVYRCDPTSIRICTDNIRNTMHPSDSEILETKKNRSKSFFVNVYRSLTSKDREKQEEEEFEENL